MNKIAETEKTALAKYEITPAKITEMAKEYMVLTVPEGDTGAYKIARKALTICVTARTGTDKRRKELGERLRDELSYINKAGKQLVAALAPVEEYLKLELGGEDDRKAAIKEEAYQKELKRIEDIQEKIADINSFGSALHFNLTMDNLDDLLQRFERTEITPDEYMEFAKEANQAKHDVHIAIQKAIEAREIFDAEEAERKAEDERLAKVKKEQEAEAKRLSEIQAEIEAEAAAVQTEKERLEREEFERKAHSKAKLQAEKEALEKIEREALEKAGKEMAEAEELARRKALEPDKSKLGYWLERIEIAIDEKPEMVGQEADLLIKNGTTWFGTVISDIRVSIEDL